MFNWVIKSDRNGILKPVKTVMESHFDKMFEDFDKIFSDDLFSSFPAVSNWKGTTDFPKVDITHDDDKFIVTAALAGIPKENVKVEYDADDNVLTIASNYSTDKETKDDKANYIKREISKRSFLRRFPFHGGSIKGEPRAEMKDGILRIEIDKAKQIEQKATKNNNITIK